MDLRYRHSKGMTNFSQVPNTYTVSIPIFMSTYKLDNTCKCKRVQINFYKKKEKTLNFYHKK